MARHGIIKSQNTQTNLIKLKGKIDKSTSIVGNSTILLLLIE